MTRGRLWRHCLWLCGSLDLRCPHGPWVLSILYILLITSQFPSPTFSPVQVYKSDGRMFLLSDIKTVRSGLDRKSKAVKEKVRVFLLLIIVMILLMIAIILMLLKVHTLIGNKEYLEKQIKESENKLRELVMAKKNSSS